MRFTEETMIRDLEDYHVVRGYRVLDKCRCGADSWYRKRHIDLRYEVYCQSCGQTIVVDDRADAMTEWNKLQRGVV